MSNFEEKSGLVECKTPWGSWGQTVDEIFIHVDVPDGTKSSDVKCSIKPKAIDLSVAKKDILKGAFWGVVLPDDCVWTLEDNKFLRIILVKSGREASNCWRSLLDDDYEADPAVFNEMEKKLTLERFQRENPGFDFSGAEVTGNYHKGGPKLAPDY
jgi:hypothetical protein